MRDSDAPLLIATYAPEWRARFLAERYDRIDPIGAKAQIAMLPFRWFTSDYAGRTTFSQRRMFDEAASFGVTQGFTVPVHQTNARASTLTFATDENATAFARNIEENRHLIQLLALHFDAHVISKLGQSINIGSHPRLSAREIECLRWTARGKSTYDVATILGISRRTVVFHLARVRQKFGVATTRQAIVDGVRCGVIRHAG